MPPVKFKKDRQDYLPVFGFWRTVSFLFGIGDLFFAAELADFNSVVSAFTSSLIPATFAPASTAPATAPVTAPIAAPLITSVKASATLLRMPFAGGATFFWQVLSWREPLF